MEIRKYLIISLFLLLGGLFVTGGQVVVKDGKLNVTEDFFVDSNVLYVNSSSNNVGIGTTGPGAALDVIKPGNANVYENGIRANRPDAQGQYAFMGYGQASQDAYFGSVYTGGGTGLYGAIHLRQYNSAMTARDVLTIDSDGQVGIGTTPEANLHVLGGAGTAIQLGQGNYNYWRFRQDSYNLYVENDYHLGGGYPPAFDTRMTITYGGKVGIGLTNPTTMLEVNGQATKPVGSGEHWATVSDERIKEGIIPIPNALNTVLSLNGREFGFKNKTEYGDQRQYGFVAQDVEKVIPRWVTTNSDGYKSLSITGDSALFVEAIKEQQTQIEQLNLKNQALEQIICLDHPDAEVCQ